jgi:AbrB family looped-hinge helix DNA binding protein
VAKVTSKLQVTIPKALASRYKIAPGDEIEWRASGDSIRLVPGTKERELDVKTRLRLFDEATLRQRAREKGEKTRAAAGRGWTREELYERGRSR